MIRAHKIIRHWRTNDFHWKRSMASHSRKLAQNHVAAPQRWEENESGYGPSGQEYYRGGPAHTHSPSIKKLFGSSRRDPHTTLRATALKYLFPQQTNLKETSVFLPAGHAHFLRNIAGLLLNLLGI